MQGLNFKYFIIQELYRHDLSIDRQILKGIIKLGQKVVPDLEMVLADIIKHDKEYSQQEDFNWYTPTHALHLLGQLHAEKSLPKILEIFKQDEDFLEFWFSDSLNEEMWEVIYKCGQNSLNLIESFLKEQSVCISSRTAVSEGLKQIALHHPGKRKMIISIYKRVIEAMTAHVKYKGKSREEDVKDMIGFYVSDLIDFAEPELNKYLMKLFEKGVVETQIVGPESIGEDIGFDVIKEIESIFDRYDELENIYNRPAGPLFNFSKVGRNDPCPCDAKKEDGTPMKFKKCHYQSL